MNEDNDILEGRVKKELPKYKRSRYRSISAKEKSEKRNWFKGWAKAAVYTMIPTALLSIPLIPHMDRQTYTVQIDHKENYLGSDREKGESTYLIFTYLVEDGKLTDEVRVFENSDSILELKFNSSDFHAALRVGERYELDTYGFRYEPKSWYENIVDYRHIKDVPEKGSQDGNGTPKETAKEIK